MRFNFKKIAPILASAILIGSAVGFASVAADLGAYPSPFIKDGKADVNIIYGADAASMDVAAMELLSSDLSSELASQTATGAASTTTVAGEGAPLGLSSRVIFFNDSLNIARTSLVAADLPNVLKTGNVVDNANVNYPYTQKITLSPTSGIAFGSSGESVDPVLHINIGSGTTQAQMGTLYNYTVTLSKNLEVNASDVSGYATIKLQGVDFTVGPSSTAGQLILYGAGTVITAKNGVEQTVSLSGADNKIRLTGTTSTTTAVLEVNGKSKTLTQGSETVYPGDIIVYTKHVYQYSTTDMSQNSVEIVIGTKKVTIDGRLANTVVTYLKDGSTVTMTGTYANITNVSGNTISGFTIGQAFKDAVHDYVALGETLTDRVFGGMKLDFASVSPALDSPLRDVITVETDNCMKVGVTFTSAYANKPYTLWYAMDSDKTCSAANWNPTTANEGNYTISLVENDTIQLNDLVVVNANDEGRIWQLIAAGNGNAGAKTKFKDVITDEEIVFDTGTNNYSTMGLYTVAVNNPDNSLKPNVTLNWGSSSDKNNYGAVRTLFPRIKLKNGEWMAILANISNSSGAGLAAGVKYALPGLELLSDYDAGLNISIWDVSNATDTVGKGRAYGNINYTIVNSTGIDGFFIKAIDTNSSNAAASYCNFTQSLGPAILLIEEKQIGLGETNGRAICVPLTTWALSGVNVPKVNTPRFVGINSGFTQLYSNAYKQQAVDRYGTFIEYATDANTGAKVTIKYPDTMMVANVYIAEVSAKATTTEVTATGVTKLGAIGLSDTEAETQQPTTNLIVVGDSCVNSVALKLASPNATYTKYGACGAKLTELYGYEENEAIIKQFNSPYSSTRIAILVAGWEKEDTMAAAKLLRDKASTLSNLTEKKLSKGVDYT